MLALVGTLLVLQPLAATAQDGPRYSFVARGASLDEALRKLITTTRLDISYDPDLVEDKRSYCVIEAEPVDQILSCLLRGTGLDYYRLSSGLYVLTDVAEVETLYGSLQGLVVDRSTGDPLPNAHVLLADGSGTVSNEFGRFVFPHLPPGTYRLTASYLGYRQQADSVHVAPREAVQAYLSLDAEPLLVTPIIVDGLQWRLPSETLGRTALEQDELLQYANGAAPDVARGLGMLVGVRQNDATADLHVQGGEAGEHEYRLDGAPVYVPVSLGGLIGPFSPFAIGRVTVQKTGFDAGIGSQSVGVVEAEHALGAAGGETLMVQADPLGANGRINLEFGEPGRVGTTFMAAGRYDMWDALTLPSVQRLLEDWNTNDPFMLAAFLSDDQADAGLNTRPFRQELTSGGDPVFGFYDAHAATRIRFGPLHSLYASTYWSRRELRSDRSAFAAQQASVPSDAAPPTRDLYQWTNSTSQARYEAVLGARLLASLQGRASTYRLGHDFLYPETTQSDFEGAPFRLIRLDPRADNGNRIREYALAARLDVSVSERWHVEAGIEPTYTKSRFLVQGTQVLPIIHASSGWRVGSHWTNRLSLSQRLTLDLGTRLTYLAAHADVYAEPRLAVRYDSPDGRLGPWSLRVATGLYRQFVNQFDVSSRSPRALLATSRTWLAVDSTVTPAHSGHVSAELLMQPAQGWTLRLESYFRRHFHLLAVNYATRGVNDNLARDDLDLTSGDLGGLPSLPQSAFLTGGEGTAYGVGVQLEKRWRRARGEVRYEYSAAQRSFGLFFAGDEVPAPWNEPHRLEVAVDWMPFDRLTLLGRWKGIWGRAWGFRQSYYDFLGAHPSLSVVIPEQIKVDVRRHLVAYRLDHPKEHILPPVYQLDLSVSYTQPLGRARLQARLDLLNVLDRNNVADWRFVFDPELYQHRGLLKREDRLLLPFTPSLALGLAW